ncbi:hypothetical protein CTEN210_06650 [Chaetoceros tenuissimus]|uniref:G-protein coupled receptors family 2 profile 2 domain-containing protein n=1 Tax=Chaetoceros tenuissimus TaxID=426638 RepID=A0AAD3CT38_9STRA|nr:hypothetical protein CTEN210_06650 [Chaetoceros tenuissimus]
MSSEEPELPEAPPIYGMLLMILPKFPCILSIIGSSMIISSVFRSEDKRQHIQQRLVAVMSVVDVIAMTSWFFTFVFMPSPSKMNLPVTLGNEASCDVLAFILQFNIASAMYNASLSLYYLLIIKYNWRQTKIANIEKYLHAVPLSWGIITAIIIVALNVTDDSNWVCWISPDDAKDPTLAKALIVAFYYGPLWLCFLFLGHNMYQVYKKVKETEERASKWRVGGDALKHTKSVARQNFLYALSFIVCWIVPSFARLALVCGADVPKWVNVMSGSLIPFQGFFNSMVYFRIRYFNFREDYPSKSGFWIVMHIVRLTMFPCCLQSGEMRDSINTDGKDFEHDLNDIRNEQSQLEDGDIENVGRNEPSDVHTGESKKLSKWEKMNKKASMKRKSITGSIIQIVRLSWRTLKRQGTCVIGPCAKTKQKDGKGNDNAPCPNCEKQDASFPCKKLNDDSPIDGLFDDSETGDKRDSFRNGNYIKGSESFLPAKDVSFSHLDLADSPCKGEDQNVNDDEMKEVTRVSAKKVSFSRLDQADSPCKEEDKNANEDEKKAEVTMP